MSISIRAKKVRGKQVEVQLLNQSLRKTSGDGAVMRIASDYLDHLPEDAFTPTSWRQAQPVHSGGRGGAWFLRRAGQDWVLRHYLRGGEMARVTRDLYLFTTENSVRSFHEFDITQILLDEGLPVPRPVAARYERVGGIFYRAQIIVERIAQARTLADCAAELPPQDRLEVGRMVRRFHDAGLNHVDLNCNNILIAPSGMYLIDFDKCSLHRKGASESWKPRNIARLHRSVQKEFRDWPAESRDQFWNALRSGYGG